MVIIGICACYDTKNYGSMLQAFATQIFLEEMGYESEFIVYKKKKNLVFLLKQIPRLFNRNLLNDKMLLIKKKTKLFFNPKINFENKIRINAFNNFQFKFYKKFSEVYYGYNALKKGAEKYHSVIVGSDQLWTPGGLGSNFYNLMFVPNNVNKVSYATSFGVNNIPFYQKNKTKEYLSRINHLSVREIRGSEIVNEIIGVLPKVVVDPTLLLTKQQWDKYIPEKNILDSKYIFCYFLGENIQHREMANQLKSKTGYKIVTTPFLDSFVKYDLKFGDERLFNIGPEDFINLIRNAEYIVTDSFHGTIFSILNHKKFLILNRFSEKSLNSRNSRIDSLLNILELQERRCNLLGECDIYDMINMQIDYDFIDKKIKLLRDESIKYLVDSLKG